MPEESIEVNIYLKSDINYRFSDWFKALSLDSPRNKSQKSSIFPQIFMVLSMIKGKGMKTAQESIKIKTVYARDGWDFLFCSFIFRDLHVFVRSSDENTPTFPEINCPNQNNLLSYWMVTWRIIIQPSFSDWAELNWSFSFKSNRSSSKKAWARNWIKNKWEKEVMGWKKDSPN